MPLDFRERTFLDDKARLWLFRKLFDRREEILAFPTEEQSKYFFARLKFYTSKLIGG